MNECITTCDFMSVQQGRQKIACAGPCDLICGLENMVTIITALTTWCNRFPTPTRLVVGREAGCSVTRTRKLGTC